MTTGQMLLSLGALILLSTMVLRFNRSVLTSDEVMYNSKFNVLATSLCTSVIEEAKGKAFDQKTDSASVTLPDQLSSTLGADYGEIYPNFNDFDDFNDFVKVDSTLPGTIFYITSKVNYIEIKPTTVLIVTNKTWHKMITVTVMSPQMKDAVTMSSTYSYWYFR